MPRIFLLPVILLCAGAAGARMGPRLQALPRAPGPARPVMTVWREAPPAGAAPCLGRVCAGRVRPEELDALARAPGLVYASVPARYRMRLDRAAALSDLPRARAESGLFGAGVLVAVIDTGLDFTHPDFLDEQGRTRVAWLVDLTRPPEGLHPDLEALAGGAVYSAADLQAVIDGHGGPALGAGRDDVGHGTHVAGIAASGDALYTGAAPGCRLVAVKAINRDRTGFEEDRMLAALAFADRVAVLEGQPLVVNLSLGNQLGAHDGSEPLELALAGLASRPGRAVAVAAGNEAGRRQHARGAVSAGGPPLAVGVLVPEHHRDRQASVTLDFWYDGDATLRIRIETPAGHRSEPVSPAGPVGLESWTPDGLVEMACGSRPAPPSPAHRVLVTLTGEPGQPLTPGTWRLVFSGEAFRLDGWIAEFDLPGAWGEPRFQDHVDPGNLVGPPATARGVIAVGAYTSRTSWVDGEGTERENQGTVGELTAYSVSGPTRDGRPKPELIAPGGSLAATLSGDSDPRSLDSIFYHAGSLRNVLADGRHAISSGSSMAAPLVAGMAALLLEQDPERTGVRVRDLLSTTTRKDGFTGHGTLFAPAWGFGKADALGPVRLVSGARPGGFDPAESLCGATLPWLPADRRFEVLLTAVPRDAHGLPLGPGQPVDILAPGAVFAGPVVDHQNGIYSRTLLGAGRRGSVLVVSCRTDGGTAQASPRIHLAASHLEHSGSGLVGGACSCQGTDPADLSVFVVLFLILGWIRLGGANCHQVGSIVIPFRKRPRSK